MPMPLCCMALPFHSSFTTGSGRQQVEGQAHQDIRAEFIRVHAGLGALFSGPFRQAQKGRRGT